MSTNSYGYAYDLIGNRTASTNNNQLTTYTANALNQYANIVGTTTNEPTYDADGNLLTYNGWAFFWDGENRLIQASNTSAVVTYAYDQQGLMFKKVVNGATNQFVWNGFNIIAEISVISTNFNMWGVDLPGTRQGAGGVGGLLSVTILTNSTVSTYLTAYDANGNITDYVSTDGIIVAHYEYDSYGNITAASGLMSNVFTHRFSTKPFEPETGLLHYEYRAYTPVLGRWLSKDPLKESGGLNLYVFCGNDAINNYDLLGLEYEIELLRLHMEAIGDLVEEEMANDSDIDKYTNDVSQQEIYDNLVQEISQLFDILDDLASLLDSLSIADELFGFGYEEIWEYMIEDPLMDFALDQIEEYKPCEQ